MPIIFPEIKKDPEWYKIKLCSEFLEKDYTLVGRTWISRDQMTQCDDFHVKEKQLTGTGQSV